MSAGLAKREPPLGLVTKALPPGCAPLPTLPRITHIVKLSTMFRFADRAPGASFWNGPTLYSGMETFLPPTGSLMSTSRGATRNWKVMSSTPSPVLSMWMR